MKLIDKLIAQCQSKRLKPYLFLISNEQGKIRVGASFGDGIPINGYGKITEQNYSHEASFHDSEEQAFLWIDALLADYGLSKNDVAIINDDVHRSGENE